MNTNIQKQNVTIHPSLLNTPAGQYVQARIDVCLLRERIKDTEDALAAASVEARSTSSSEAFDVLLSLPARLEQYQKALISAYEKIKSGEELVTPEAYEESLAKFLESYEAESDKAPLLPGDQERCSAILALQDQMAADANGWSEVSGSQEASWLAAAMKAAGLKHRIEKQEEHFNAIKEESAQPDEKGVPPGKPKARRSLSEKEQQERKERVASRGVLDGLRREHKNAAQRADLLSESIDTDKADRLIDHDLKKLAKLRNLRPSVMIRTILLHRIKNDIQEKRKAKKNARIEGLVEDLVSVAERILETPPINPPPGIHDELK